jgi:phosphodiesterase/alkaline phosphatase D-like protein
MKKIFYFFLCFSFFSANAQQINSGPLVGGVTPSSARIYYRTNVNANFNIEVDLDTLFNNPQIFNCTTSSNSNNVIIKDVTGLLSNQKYYYRAEINNNYHTIGSFKTFPNEGVSGNYKVVVGSCNYHDHWSGGGALSPDSYFNDILFNSIVDFDPYVVLHLGDWNYPSTAFGWDYNLNDSLVAESFSLRYQDYNMLNYIMPNLPVDYIYDDDYSQNNSAGWTYPTINTANDSSGNPYFILADPSMPNGIRTGAIEGYFTNFPGYPQTDTTAIHHSFKLGNIEFFVLDTRLSKDPIHEVFVFDSTTLTYSFNPPQGHSTLGETQKNWLLNELSTSNADWKVICSSVVFNKQFTTLLPILINKQPDNKELIKFAADLAYMWAGYPEDMDDLLNTINDQNIENVIMLSGDTHSSMMDDGTNSGIPELSASGWAAGNEGVLNYTIDSIALDIGIPNFVETVLWNGGGNGINNINFSDTYGTLEFFSTDSLRMCIKDEFNQLLSCQTIPFGNSTAITRKYIPQNDLLLVYPNPAKNSLKCVVSETYTSSKIRIEIYSMDGMKKVAEEFIDSNNIIISLKDINKGTYVLQLTSKNQTLQKKFIKH